MFVVSFLVLCFLQCVHGSHRYCRHVLSQLHWHGWNCSTCWLNKVMPHIYSEHFIFHTSFLQLQHLLLHHRFAIHLKYSVKVFLYPVLNPVMLFLFKILRIQKYELDNQKIEESHYRPTCTVSLTGEFLKMHCRSGISTSQKWKRTEINTSWSKLKKLQVKAQFYIHLISEKLR